MIQPIPPITNEEITGQFVVHLIGADAGMILEIDAHHGGHTAAFLKFFPQAQIHAFEPDPRAVRGVEVQCQRSAFANPRDRYRCTKWEGGISYQQWTSA